MIPKSLNYQQEHLAGEFGLSNPLGGPQQSSYPRKMIFSQPFLSTQSPTGMQGKQGTAEEKEMLKGMRKGMR